LSKAKIFEEMGPDYFGNVTFYSFCKIVDATISIHLCCLIA